MPSDTLPPHWWEKEAFADIYNSQLRLFGKHLLEFYSHDRGNQTYLDFLRWYHPEIIGQFMEVFIQAMRQTQPELLGIKKKQWEIKDALTWVNSSN